MYICKSSLTVNIMSVSGMLQESGRPGESVIEFDLTKETDAFLAGHAIDGRVLFPATGYLVCVLYCYHRLLADEILFQFCVNN